MSTTTPGDYALAEKDKEIHRLQARVSSLSHQLETALHKQNKTRNHQTPLSPHTINVREEFRQNKRTITAQRERLGRNASITTQRVLDQLHNDTSSSRLHPNGVPPTLQRILDMFQQPSLHLDYLNSPLFCNDLLRIATKLRVVLEREPRVVFLQSPVYVFGDIHGNLEDLHFFSDNLWRLGMSLSAGNFLFLGDYVDRGLSCLECVSYLFALKLQMPNKIFLLRGNHETRDVNGWEEHYGERSFIYQCRNRFGDDNGYRLWEACNQVFDRLPLAAVIDQDIFCVHGGIPRPIRPTTTRVQDILTVPRVAGINPPYEHEDSYYQQVASDCIWSDPASEEQELTTVDPESGFGNSLRGGGAICFGHKAVTDFLTQHSFHYILRAHEAHAEGVAVSKGARVFTVFSTSKDHNQGAHAMAGCILVDNEKLQVINRSPAYKNQYVHRRDSVSLAKLSKEEIDKRVKLGLVTGGADVGAESSHHGEEDEELDYWEDLEDGDDAKAKGGDLKEEAYVFDTGRRSSVDLASMTSNSHDDRHNSNGDDPMEPDSKRHRSKRPSVTAIQEETGIDEDDDDIATVDGDEDVELRDADGVI